MPACPWQRRVAVHVFGIDDGAGIKKKLNGLFGSKGGDSMKQRFTFRSAVAHEAGAFPLCIWQRIVGAGVYAPCARCTLEGR